MKDYNTYQAEDFAQDDAFIRWVKGRDAEGAQFWEQWKQANPHRLAELEAGRTLVLGIRFTGKVASADKMDDLWSKIEAQTADTSIKQPKIGRRRILAWATYAAAACIAVLFLLWYSDSATTIKTELAEQELLELPDGSSVYLNANSSISYEAEDWPNERLLELKGEAFFEVEKGSSFTVRTPHGEVQVLGTRFNVYARRGTFEVQCVSGKVQVQTVAGSKKILTAGQQTELRQQGQLSEVASVDASRRAAWTKGEFYFDKGRMERVFDELERQFDVQISADQKILDRIGTVNFENTDLDSALYRVTWPMQLKVEKKGKRYKIVEE